MTRRQKQKTRSPKQEWIPPADRNRPKPIGLDQLITINPLTHNQEEAFNAWDDGHHLALVGSAGTGKTFLAIYMALELVMDKSTPYDSLKILRSIVPVRDPGHLPGTVDDKIEIFNAPYKAICTELFESPTAYDRLVDNDYISFESTSFIRGVTMDNTIIVVDEIQNLNFHELDSVITRVGQDTRIIFSGDYNQSDFKSKHESDGINKFLSIIERMNSFRTIRFTWEDICRSDFVRDYIMTKEWMETEGELK